MGLTSKSTRTRKQASRAARIFASVDVGSLLVRLITVLVFIFLYVPIAVIVLMSFYPGTYQTFPLPGFSLRWYAEFFQDELLIRSLLTSLVLALAVSAISAIIGTPCALGLVRYSFPGKRILNTLVLAPMIIPQIIIGISLLILLNAIHLPKGYPYMLIGHVLLTLPYIVVTVSSQLYGFPRELEEAALSLGANPLQTFFEITLPIIAPSIFAGMLFAFTVSFQEFVATQTWATPATSTLPIRIYGRIRDALTPEINVVGVIMVLLALFVPLLVQLANRHNKQEGSIYGA